MTVRYLALILNKLPFYSYRYRYDEYIFQYKYKCILNKTMLKLIIY